MTTLAVPTSPPPPTEPDEALARLARAGSAAAFETLVRRYQVPLLRFLQRRGTPWEAEDVLQESFLRAYQSLHRYREGRPFKPWLFTIAYRLSIDAGRQRAGPRAAVDDPADGGPGPAERSERAESAERLWSAVRAALGDEPFTAVWLHYADGLPPREVAAVMNRSQVWVRTTLHRARRRLADVLGVDRGIVA